jgi:hypothetical protein
MTALVNWIDLGGSALHRPLPRPGKVDLLRNHSRAVTRCAGR